MKKLIPFIMLVSLIGCCPTHCKSRTVGSAEHCSSSDLFIISATFGSGITFADVTARVSELIQQPNTSFLAQPKWLHADPTPGQSKSLIITYSYRGRRHLYCTVEGTEVNRPKLIHQAKFES